MRSRGREGRCGRDHGSTCIAFLLLCAFTVPGDGAVDFRVVVGVLRRHGYRGWLVVEAEQDPVVAPAYRYADMGYRHLTRLVRNGVGQ